MERVDADVEYQELAAAWRKQGGVGAEGARAAEALRRACWPAARLT